MITTAILNLPTGHVITGRIETSRPNQPQAVEWSGPVEKLSHPLEESDSYTLEVYVENQAKLADATWKVDRQGEWEVPI